MTGARDERIRIIETTETETEPGVYDSIGDTTVNDVWAKRVTPNQVRALINGIDELSGKVFFEILYNDVPNLTAKMKIKDDGNNYYRIISYQLKDNKKQYWQIVTDTVKQ